MFKRSIRYTIDVLLYFADYVNKHFLSIIIDMRRIHCRVEQYYK